MRGLSAGGFSAICYDGEGWQKRRYVPVPVHRPLALLWRFDLRLDVYLFLIQRELFFLGVVRRIRQGKSVVAVAAAELSLKLV